MSASETVHHVYSTYLPKLQQQQHLGVYTPRYWEISPVLGQLHRLSAVQTAMCINGSGGEYLAQQDQLARSRIR